MIRNLPVLASLWVIFAGAYAVAFFIMVTVNIDAARSRFDVLVASSLDGRAIGHGEQIIALHQRQDGAVEDLDHVKRQLAIAHRDHGDPLRAIALFRDLVTTAYFAALSVDEKIFIQNTLARLELDAGNGPGAAAIFAAFLDAAGDDAAQPANAARGSISARYLGHVIDAMASFTEAMPPVPVPKNSLTPDRETLDVAVHMTDLGGFYAGQPDGAYAAAGLLAQAHQVRSRLLGEADSSTVHTALLLGPVYQKIGRLRDAERIYLAAFHAQERVKGANNPELSLYLRLLIDLYTRQERFTEAEALNLHVRGMFKDAFGARRYLPNQLRDRRDDVSRPVSGSFELDKSYRPTDLVRADRYDIPLSKPEISEEMQVRLAQGEDEAATLPAQLEALIAVCALETGENISLRSGYRSYETQVWLYKSAGTEGFVTPPGTSEHQLGLAVDIDVDRRFMRQTDAAYQCFTTHAWQYGFILSYPPGNTYLDGPVTFEPWHWRFVSRGTARLFRETGPLNMPQEFLAALPCYEERAQAGLWRNATEEHVCLQEGVTPAGP